MVDVAQQVRALDCGSRGRRFESGLPPSNTLIIKPLVIKEDFSKEAYLLHSKRENLIVKNLVLCGPGSFF